MTMKRYIEQLVEDLEEAKNHAPPENPELELLEDENALFELLELGEEIPLSERLGIPKKAFPPENQLNDNEIKLLVEKILELWGAYHYLADLPKGLPVRIAYKTLMSVWEDPVPYCALGNFHFDFYSHELDQYVQPMNTCR